MIDRGPASGVAAARTRLWRRWVAATTAGETVGFLVPAAVAAMLPGGVGHGGRAVALVLAGAVEGSLLGWAQSRVLRTAIPSLDGWAWTVRTAVAAMVAWGIGMVPSTWWDELTGLPAAVTAVLGLTGGLVLLASIGVAQWTVLRRHLQGSARWIGWTAAAWLAGLAIFLLVSTPLWQPGQGTVTVAAIGLLGGALMALTVAAVTGWGLLRLLDGDRRPGRNRSGRPVPA